MSEKLFLKNEKPLKSTPAPTFWIFGGRFLKVSEVSEKPLAFSYFLPYNIKKCQKNLKLSELSSILKNKKEL